LGEQRISPLPLGEGQGVRAAAASQEHVSVAPPTALTLTLSQRERGPSQTTLFQRERGPSRLRWVELVLLLLTIAPTAALLVAHVGEELRTGMFFGAGATALMTLLTLVWLRLRAGMTGSAVAVGRGNLVRMALRNAARNPGRSTLTIGLVAAASFIIVSVSAFRLDPTQQTPSLHSGNGGFALVAESDQPIVQDLDSPTARSTLGFSADDEKLLAGSTIVGLRAVAGDDASCLNLYRPRQPRVLGVPRRFIDRDGFAWADVPRDCSNPWQLLEHRDSDDPIPVILEKNTANYALQLWGGLGETFEISDGRGRPVRLQVVALLADSVFQGDLLVGESSFLRLFPDANGYRLFLIETGPALPKGTVPSSLTRKLGQSPRPEQTAMVQETLERDLGEYGFSAETTGRRLAELLAVQNTYLSTFQSLGGLGLLLGTFGLATVQLRNVLERRGELALLRATGFRRVTLAWLVLLEHAALLAAGLGVGTIAASLAIGPHLLDRGVSVPWASLAVTLAAVLIVGLAAGALAVRAVVRAPLLAALREA